MTAEEIQAIFFAECEESLAAAEQGLAACKEGTQDSDTVNAVFRGVHSIKGGAGAFGYSALQAFTHTFETLLSDVRDGTVAITEPLIDLMLIALDTLSDHVTAARDSTEPPEDAALQAELTAAMAANAGAAPAPVAAPVAIQEPMPVSMEAKTIEPSDDDFDLDFDLDALLDDISGEIGDAQPAGVMPRWEVRVRAHSAAMRNGSEPLLMLREMAELGGICTDCDTSAIPPLDSFDPGTGYFGWVFSFPVEVSEAAVRDIFDFVGDDCTLVFGENAQMPPIRFPAPVAQVAPPVAAPAATAPLAAAADLPNATPVAPAEDAQASRSQQAPPAPPCPRPVDSHRIVQAGQVDRRRGRTGHCASDDGPAPRQRWLERFGRNDADRRPDARHPGIGDGDSCPADRLGFQPCAANPARTGIIHRQTCAA
jgi:two-component system chemotaxis sensor kinase CheA